MKNIKALLEEIKSESISLELIQQLDILESEINAIFVKISNCTNIEQAKDYFDVLQDTQHIVSQLIFQEEIEISDGLWKFFKDFDRIDDQRVREYIFQEIRNGTYSLAAGGFLWYR